MGHPITALPQRTASFNPEAVAFSPVFSSSFLQNVDNDSLTASAPPEISSAAFSMAPIFNHSSFQAAGGTQSLYLKDSLAPAPVRLEEFLSPDMQVLVKRLEEHSDVQEIRKSSTPIQKTAHSVQAATVPPTYLPTFTFPASLPQPDYSAVDINELSAGLGLPAPKVETNDDISLAASRRSRLSQAHPGALYGKLIGWALGKPLTAKGLAQYLQNQDVNASSESQVSTTSPTANTVHRDANMVRALSRSVQELQDTSGALHALTPALSETNLVPKGSSASQYQHCRSPNSSASFRHHTRNQSKRRYSRRTLRAKRMDQGPMPSAADIYPDDANWTPTPMNESFDYVSYQNQPLEQSQVIVSNAFSWPTSAQVYEPGPVLTAADVDAADNDVLDLMKELPEPSPSTLINLGVTEELNALSGVDLLSDRRALTPAQLDGSRYGLKFHGIALGDEWELPQAGGFGESKSFRVRPREHNGWGGWEWALERGWGSRLI